MTPKMSTPPHDEESLHHEPCLAHDDVRYPWNNPCCLCEPTMFCRWEGDKK